MTESLNNTRCSQENESLFHPFGLFLLSAVIDIVIHSQGKFFISTYEKYENERQLSRRDVNYAIKNQSSSMFPQKPPSDEQSNRFHS